jgi:biopolymer transport protein TolR
MGFKVDGGNGAISDINVTPLVDVMLVLLVIFMITATLIRYDQRERKAEMDVPVTRGGTIPVVDILHPDKLVLVIDENLRVYIEDSLITDCSAAVDQPSAQAFAPCFDEITQKLGQNPRLRREREIYVMADTDIPYGFVVGSLHRIRQAGVDKVGMVTNPDYFEVEELF